MSKNTAPKKKYDDSQFELEQQFILRMPPGSAMALLHDLNNNTQNLKDKLNIELDQDCRVGKVVYGGLVMPAQLVDLPTIVESFKTIDKKTFYKTADISQMLICGNLKGDLAWKHNDDTKYKWNHGLTPPLKNVRKKRFRKTVHKNNPEQPDIEKEVKRLFRMDNEAIDVKWEVVVEQEKDNDNEKQVLAHGAYNKNILEQAKQAQASAISNVYSEFNELDMFGEMSSSSGDDTDVESTTNVECDNNDLQTRLVVLGVEIERLKESKLANRLDQQIPHSPDTLSKIHAKYGELQDECEKKEQEHKLLAAMMNS